MAGTTGLAVAPTKDFAKAMSASSSSASASASASSSFVLSPSIYLQVALENKGVQSRSNSFSLESAEYFEPLEEGHIALHMLEILEADDAEMLHDAITSNEEIVLQRNQSGETLLHLACRIGAEECARQLLQDEQGGEGEESTTRVPLKTRDRHGRTVLHAACMASQLDYDTILQLISLEPQLVTFEDDYGFTPFEYVESSYYGEFAIFLRSHDILFRLQQYFTAIRR